MATVERQRLQFRQRAPVDEDSGLHRHIGRTGLLFAAVGSIIGSGWLFGAMNASQLAGPAAMIAWALGGVMILLVGLTYAELGAMFPVSGGVVRYPHYAFGSFASYVMGWITWLAAASVAPIEVEAAIQYASNNIGGLAHASAASGGNPVLTFPLGYAVAVVLMAIFCFINMVGIRAFTRANTPIVWWKLGVISLVVVAFLVTEFHGSNFSHFGGFMPYGWHGVFASISTAGIVFSYLGFRQGVELAGESDNPRRNVPLAVIGSVLIAGTIYVLLLVAFALGLIFFLPFPGWQKLVSFITSATVLSFGSGPLVWAALRKELPDRERPFRLRGGHTIPFLAFFSSNMIVYWAGWDTNWKLFLAIVLGLILLVVYKVARPSALPAMDWRAGAWVLPWLGALALVSYLGSYGDSAAKVFGLGVGALLMLGVSAAVYLAAYHLRLRGRDVIDDAQA